MNWKEEFDKDLGDGFLTDEYYPDGAKVKDWIQSKFAELIDEIPDSIPQPEKEPYWDAQLKSLKQQLRDKWV